MLLLCNTTSDGNNVAAAAPARTVVAEADADEKAAGTKGAAVGRKGLRFAADVVKDDFVVGAVVANVTSAVVPTSPPPLPLPPPTASSASLRSLACGCRSGAASAATAAAASCCKSG
jgi:hypothetical protein